MLPAQLARMRYALKNAFLIIALIKAFLIIALRNAFLIGQVTNLPSQHFLLKI